jgi:titin
MKTKSTFLILLFFLSQLRTFAQWERTNGPDGGSIEFIFKTNNNLLVSSTGGSVHLSKNNGNSWAFNTFGSNYGNNTSGMAEHNGTIYMPGNNGSGQYNYSTDGGDTWSSAYARLNTTSYLSAYTQCFYTYGKLLFWGGRTYSATETAVMVSADSGKTWTARTGLGNPLRMYNGQVSGFTAIGSALFAATSQGVFFSSDTGNIWSARNTGITGTNFINNIWANGTNLFAINNYGYIYTSADSAKTWTRAENGIVIGTKRGIKNIVVYKGLVLGSAFANDTLYKFNNALLKWEPYSHDIKGNYGQSFFGSGDTLYMGSLNGLYFSRNNGVNWTPVTNKISAANLSEHITSVGNKLFVSEQNGSLFSSSNQGSTWETHAAPSSSTGSLYSFFATSNGILFWSKYLSNMMSADTGKTWSPISNVASYIESGVYFNSKYFFVSGNSLFSSVDTGKTLTNITNSIDANLGSVYQLSLINGSLWLATSKKGILKSTNGTTWITSNTGLPSNYNSGTSTYDTACQLITGTNTYLITRANDSGTDKIFISFNNGQTWSFRSNAYFPRKIVNHNNNYFSGQYMTTDTFATYNYGFSTGITPPYNGQIVGLHVLDNYIYGVNYAQGVWRRPLTSLSSPNVPTGNAVGLTQSTIKLSWNKVNNSNGYRIYYATSSTGTYYYLTNVSQNDTTFIHNVGGTPGTTYYYKLEATNEFGKSAQSSAFTGTTINRPQPPTNTIALGISTSQIRLHWSTNNNTATKYYIERSTSSSCCFSLIDSVMPTDTFYTVNALNKNTTFWFRLRCIDFGGYSNYTPSFSGRTNDTLPKSPVRLVATASNQYRVNLTWADSSDNETHFIIERKDNVAGSFTAIDSVSSNINNYTADLLTANTKYWFRVRAKNSGGYSLYTNIDSATTYPAPIAPNNLIITSRSSSSVGLSWQDNSSNEIAFVIERTTSLMIPFTRYDSTSSGDVTSRTITGLNPNTRYYFRIRAKDSYGYSTYSNVVDTITLPNIPTTPTNLVANTVTEQSIRLNWNDNSSNETYFYIEKSLHPTSSFVLVDSVPSNTTTYLATQLNSSTYYYFRIRAWNIGGHSSYSNSAMGVTQVSAPTAPTALQATEVSSAHVRLSWTDNAYNEIAFEIHRSLLNANNYTVIDQVAAGVTSYIDGSVVSGNAYDYKVLAKNAAGNSAFSNIIGVQVLNVAPPSPTGLTANAINHYKIALNWDAPTTNPNKHIIERKKGTAPFEIIDSVNGNLTSYIDSNLLYSTTYIYRIKAFIVNAEVSGYSGDAGATTSPAPTTAPDAPTDLIAKSTTHNSVKISWTDLSNNEDMFYIEVLTNGTFQIIDSVLANINEYTHLMLTENTPYTYRVKAKNQYGHSGYSNQITATTKMYLTAPEGLFTEQLSTYTFKLNWIDNNDGENGYIIERSAQANDGFMAIDSVLENVNTYTDNLPGKGIYYYRLKAKKNNQYSSYSNLAVAVNILAGLADNEQTSISIFPIPSNEYIHVTALQNISKIQIFSLQGQLVLDVNELKGNESNIQINISSLPKGNYVIATTLSDNNVSYNKIVKQ